MASRVGETGALGIPMVSLKTYYEAVERQLLLKLDIDVSPSYKQWLEENPETADDIKHRAHLVLGRPGIGKTAGTKNIVRKVQDRLKALGREEKVGFITIPLGSTIVGEFNSLPVAVRDQLVAFVTPKLPREERDGKYGILLLDEVTTADLQQVQPCLALTDCRGGIDGYTMPEGWVVCAAGNGPDCSNFVRLDEATQRRFYVYDIDFRLDDWKTYAHSRKIHPSVLGFLSAQEDNNQSTIENFISQPMPDLSEIENNAQPIIASPARWEMASQEMYIHEIRDGWVFDGKMRNDKGRPTKQALVLRSILGEDVATVFSKYLEMIYGIKNMDSSNMSEENLALTKGITGDVGKKVCEGTIFDEYNEYAKKHNFTKNKLTGNYEPHAQGLQYDTYSFFVQESLLKITKELEKVIKEHGDAKVLTTKLETMQNSTLCKYLANFCKWFLGYDTIASVFATFNELHRTLKVKGEDGLLHGVDAILLAPEFTAIMCPELDVFTQDYGEYITSSDFSLEDA